MRTFIVTAFLLLSIPALADGWHRSVTVGPSYEPSPIANQKNIPPCFESVNGQKYCLERRAAENVPTYPTCYYDVPTLRPQNFTKPTQAEILAAIEVFKRLEYQARPVGSEDQP